MDDLIERLTAEWSSEPDLTGTYTTWLKNPDGPEAAARIAALEAELEATRKVLAATALRSEKIEADKARLMGLVKDADALNVQVAHVLLGKACRADITAALEELRPLSVAVSEALAKIKESYNEA